MCLLKEALKNGNEEELVEIVVVVVYRYIYIYIYIVPVMIQEEVPLFSLLNSTKQHCSFNHDVVVHSGLHLSLEPPPCCWIS